MRLNVRNFLRALLYVVVLFGLVTLVSHFTPRDSWEDAVRQIQARIKLAAKMGKDINFWEVRLSAAIKWCQVTLTKPASLHLLPCSSLGLD